MGFRLSFLETRYFCPDEGQHLHVAWCISKGLIPYRDFFEHHTPLMHFGIAPLLRFYSVDTDPDSAVSFIFMLRRLMWLTTGGILAMVFFLGRQWRGWRVGLIACTLLVNEELFLCTSVEIRPDVPAQVLMLASVWVLLEALASGRARRFAVSGLLLGGAVLCNLKILFIGPPGLLIFLWYVSDARVAGGWQTKLGHAGSYSLGFACPLLMVAAGFAWHGALSELIEGILLVSAGWKERVSPLEWFLDCVFMSPLAVALALTGWVRGLAGMLGSEAARRGDPVVVLSFTGLFGGTFIVSVPWAQYHLVYLPLGALLAASCLLDCVEAASRRHWTRFQGIKAAATLAGLVGLSILALNYSKAWQYTGWLCLAALALALASARLGARDVAAAVLVLALAAWPLHGLVQWPHHTNELSLRQVRFIIANSHSADTVLDGSVMMAPFRPHAYRYYFLNTEMRLMLSGRERASFLMALEDGRIAPRFLLLDEHLRKYCPAAVPFYESRYRPTGVPDVWIRK